MVCLSRRRLLVSSACALVAASASSAFGAPTLTSGLLREALSSLGRHAPQIPNRDLIAVADFSLPSRLPRFHLVNVAEARVVASHLVAHGRGSDPHHTGWLERFSNEPGSYATAAGAYRTDGFYNGGHGRSIRLSGLDSSNDNAMSRAIVVHAAPYVGEGMAVLGRSQGCFALSASSLNSVMERLGPGRMIYAGGIGGPTAHPPA